MSVLRDESEAVYVLNLTTFALDVEAGGHSENWLRFCMFSWPQHTLSFLEGLKVFRNATKFERRHRLESEGANSAGQDNRDYFPVPPEEWERPYVATPTP